MSNLLQYLRFLPSEHSSQLPHTHGNLESKEALDVAKQLELKARLNGIAAKMSEFNFVFL